MPQEPKNRPYLKPNEVARLLMVSPATVRNWARQGHLPSHPTLGGHRRFFREDVERFARSRGLVLHTGGRKQLRVLIADDDDGFCAFLQDYLRVHDEDVFIEVAHSGFEVGRAVQAFGPDILILDLMMPGMSGFDVCRLLKKDQSTRRIRIIAVTGNYTDEYRKRILEAGAETCLAKPLDFDGLLGLLGIDVTPSQ